MPYSITRYLFRFNSDSLVRDLQLLCFNEGQVMNDKQALNRSTSQLGHDPHGYNPVNYQRHYHWAGSSTRMFQRGPQSSTCLSKQGTITLLQLAVRSLYSKFSDGDGPNLCRVKKLVPHLLKIYFGLG